MEDIKPSTADIIQKCDSIITNIIVASEDEYFLPEILINYYYNDNKSLMSWDELQHVLIVVKEIKEKWSFAVIFMEITKFCISFGKDELKERNVDVDKFKKKLITEDFINKNKYFIDWLWEWIIYFNIWPLIKFISSLFIIATISKITKY